MEFPARLKTVAGEVRIAHGDLVDDDLGNFVPGKALIQLSPEQTPDTGRASLMHEVWHHFVFSMGLRNDLSKKTEERMADLFAVYFTDLVRRNPKFITYLRG